MSVLKGLVFTAVPRNAGLTPEQHRRAKLAAHLREQCEIAKAQLEGRIHVVKKRRWEYTDDGQKHLIEVDKRLKQWWKRQPDGKVVLAVRYGSKPLEFEKGKAGIAVGALERLIPTIKTLIAATTAGELDGLLEPQKATKPSCTLTVNPKPAERVTS